MIFTREPVTQLKYAALMRWLTVVIGSLSLYPRHMPKDMMDQFPAATWNPGILIMIL